MSTRTTLNNAKQLPHPQRTQPEVTMLAKPINTKQLKNSSITHHHYELHTEHGPQHVIVSRNTDPTINETSIFKATSKGRIRDWTELRAYPSSTTPEEALQQLGYQILKQKEK